MFKITAILMALAVAGCASGVTYVIPSRPSNVATLFFRAPTDTSAYPFAKGIQDIDDLHVSPYADKVFLSPGKHEIGLNCTQVISTGEQPTIVFEFVAGASYVLECADGTPQIQHGLIR